MPSSVQCARGVPRRGRPLMPHRVSLLAGPGGFALLVGPLRGVAAWEFRGPAVGLLAADETPADPVAVAESVALDRPAVGRDELLADMVSWKVVVGETSVGRFATSEPSIVPGSVGSATLGRLSLSVGETNPSNPGRAICVVSVNPIATQRMRQIATTTFATQSMTAARRPVSSLKTGLVPRMARQSPNTAPVLTGPRSC
jgi:hypothetical protein